MCYPRKLWLAIVVACTPYRSPFVQGMQRAVERPADPLAMADFDINLALILRSHPVTSSDIPQDRILTSSTHFWHSGYPRAREPCYPHNPCLSSRLFSQPLPISCHPSNGPDTCSCIRTDVTSVPLRPLS